MLDQEFLYYIENQENLVNKFNGKYLVIKDQKVLQAFDSEIDAVLVQKCESGQENYTAIFHSRFA